VTREDAGIRVLFCTCAPDGADSLAAALVEQRLAACVNVLPGATSVYRWKGSVERDAESLLVIKTATDRVDDLVRALPDLHPYDTPELIALPVTAGLADYVDWVKASTKD